MNIRSDSDTKGLVVDTVKLSQEHELIIKDHHVPFQVIVLSTIHMYCVR